MLHLLLGRIDNYFLVTKSDIFELAMYVMVSGS